MDKWIWVIAGGLLQVPCIKIAHDLGYKILITDKNENCACASLADCFERIDTRDVAANLDFAKSLDNIDAVFTAGAEVPVTVACVTRQLGLSGLEPGIALNISNKANMRRILVGKPYSIRYCVDSDFYLSFNAARELFGENSPFVVKATDGSGSRGLTKCAKLSEFTNIAFERAQKVSSDGKVLVEELLLPDPNEEFAEQSVETIWKDGSGYFLNYVDRPFLSFDKWAIEVGHLNPAMHSEKVQKEVEYVLMDAGKTLEMDTGVLKADIMLTTHGVKVLELTPRLSGGFDSAYTSPLAHGVDYIKAALLLALGDDIHWELLLPKQYRHAVAMSVFPKPGRITRIEHNVAGVTIISRAKVGDIIPEYTTCVDRPLFVIADGDSRYEAVGKAKEALSKIIIETEAV